MCLSDTPHRMDIVDAEMIKRELKRRIELISFHGLTRTRIERRRRESTKNLLISPIRPAGQHQPEMQCEKNEKNIITVASYYAGCCVVVNAAAASTAECVISNNNNINKIITWP